MARPTIALWNTYGTTWLEAHRRALARAGPLARVLDAHLLLVQWPIDDMARALEIERPRTPADAAAAVAGTTTIGHEGDLLRQLAAEGRVHVAEHVPPQFNPVIVTTSRPERDPLDAYNAHDMVRAGATLLFGLGPRGLPAQARALGPHWDLTGSRVPLETATALGAAVGVVLGLDLSEPRLAVDAVVVRGNDLLVVQRAKPPHKGALVLPGGFVEPGEPPERAVLRELEEETGLAGRVEGLVGVYGQPGRDPRFHNVSIAYRVAADGDPRGSGEGRAQWVPLVPALGFDHGRIVADALRQSG